MSIDDKETRPSEKLQLIGPDDVLKQSIKQCIETLYPKLFEQNIGIAIKITPEYLIEAAQMLKGDPNFRLIMLGCAGDKPDKRLFDALTNNNRVCKANLSNLERILELSWQFQKDIESGKKPEQDPDNEKELDDALFKAITCRKEKELSILRHDLKPHVIKEKGMEYKKIIESARELIDFGEDVSNKEVEEYILGTSREVREVINEEIDGVFCDVEGTLLVDEGRLNPQVVELLLSFINEGKKVTIWTAGSLEHEKRKIEKAVQASNDINETEAAALLNLRVASKYNYAGATVETAIDDMSQESLKDGFKLKSKEHIKV